MAIHEEPTRAEHLAELLKALGHPLRLRIVSLLAEGPVHVNALAETLHAPQAVISQQLRILRMSALVDVTRENGHATYRLAEPQLHAMLACMSRCQIPVRVPAAADAVRTMEDASVDPAPESSPADAVGALENPT